MPSVMDTIRFHEKFQSLSTSFRNQIIKDTITWLEKEERAKCKPENLTMLIAFENELQSQLNQPHVSQVWFQHFSSTYRSMPFYDKFIRRMLI
jgi:hypothetical protein